MQWSTRKPKKCWGEGGFRKISGSWFHGKREKCLLYVTSELRYETEGTEVYRANVLPVDGMGKEEKKLFGNGDTFQSSTRNAEENTVYQVRFFFCFFAYYKYISGFFFRVLSVVWLPLKNTSKNKSPCSSLPPDNTLPSWKRQFFCFFFCSLFFLVFFWLFFRLFAWFGAGDVVWYKQY